MKMLPGRKSSRLHSSSSEENVEGDGSATDGAAALVNEGDEDITQTIHPDEIYNMSASGEEISGHDAPMSPTGKKFLATSKSDA